MDLKQISPFFTVSPQLSPADVGAAASRGFKAIINNRPDGEEDGQPTSAEIEAAAAASGLDYRHIPVVGGKISDDDVAAFETAMEEVTGPVLAYCRTGTRSATLWALSEARHVDADALIGAAGAAGYDLASLKPRLESRLRNRAKAGAHRAAPEEARAFDVVVVGGGAGGIAAAASLLKRRPQLSLAIVEPREVHYYQPGWTLVGGGVFDRHDTERPMAELMPEAASWIRTAVSSFDPERRQVVLEDGSRLEYKALIAAPGIKLDWDRIDGLKSALGRNGVTSNYLFDLAPYTWDLVQATRKGRALFTQPPMPIKCAGAPQKAMYLSCDAWTRKGVLSDIDVEFHNAGPVLFGVPDYVPALMEYVERYGIDLNFGSKLVAVDGEKKIATFERAGDNGPVHVERDFEMLHVCPPQTAPDFVARSPLAGEGGWISVSPETLQHTVYGNVFALGDACSAPNAKTAAAVRAQAPVVAENVAAVLEGKSPRAVYNGYGSCPLTVERGKIVLAEFGYGGKLLPTFPKWVVDGTKPTRLAWFLKEKMLPSIYFDAMLRGKEWMMKLDVLPHDPASRDAPDACGEQAKAGKAA
ncbi:MAG: TIGR01244 family sulfur transferase [Oceanicaulis sp.]